MRDGIDPGRVRAWVLGRLVPCGRSLAVAVLFSALGLPLLVFCLVSLGLIGVLGLGVVLVPLVTVGVRALANLRRTLAGRWSRVPIAVPYRPRPGFERRGVVGWWQRLRWVLSDPATWRDLVWLCCCPVNLLLGMFPAALVWFGAEAILAAPLLDTGAAQYVYGVGWPAHGLAGSLLAVAQGVVALPLGLAIAPGIARIHAGFAAALLGPTRAARADGRIRRLAETRALAVDAQAAELRRIERDLHDGAQARLVALGMNLGMAEDLFAADPDRALRLLAQARQSSGQALAELRDLARGIHPPVLAERGLDGAIRALALSLALPVDVDIALPARPPAAVESAAYFAVAEALANVIKHSGAHRARVRVAHVDGVLVLAVADDGRGGADAEGGSGLRGIQRRLAVFDGTLELDSPCGGPTTLRMELPCALSSPRT